MIHTELSWQMETQERKITWPRVVVGKYSVLRIQGTGWAPIHDANIYTIKHSSGKYSWDLEIGKENLSEKENENLDYC